MAEYINKTDTLNEGRVKLNAAISDSNIARGKAEQADVKSTQALANSESTQTQLDTIVIDGDSSVEAAQARVDEKGEGHATLKARIDDGFERTNSQLADIAVNVKTFGAKGDGKTNDTIAIDNAINSIDRGTIFFPPGIYIVDHRLNQRAVNLKTNINVVGSGVGSTTIRLSDSAKSNTMVIGSV